MCPEKSDDERTDGWTGERTMMMIIIIIIAVTKIICTHISGRIDKLCVVCTWCLMDGWMDNFVLHRQNMTMIIIIVAVGRYYDVSVRGVCDANSDSIRLLTSSFVVYAWEIYFRYICV